MSNSTRSLVTKQSDTILIELGRIGARPRHEVKRRGREGRPSLTGGNSGCRRRLGYDERWLMVPSLEPS